MICIVVILSEERNDESKDLDSCYRGSFDSVRFRRAETHYAQDEHVSGSSSTLRRGLR